jgi:hypothetical protein
MAKREAIARDEHYDLVSVLYHALQGDETLDQYIEDAEDAEDTELAAHFRSVQQAYREIAQQTKELLKEKMLSSEGEEEEADEDEED